MSVADVQLEERLPMPFVVDASPPHSDTRTAPMLMGAWSSVLVLADVLVIFGAFMVAYWARFILPDASDAALGIALYARIGLAVGLIGAVLFATHGLYDQEQQLGGAAHFRAVVSSISTALVLAVAVSYVIGDQAYSRLWFATGWLFAAIFVLVWRSCARHIYAALRSSLAPSRRVLVVGANELGESLANELTDVFHVVGFVDNGTDLERPTRFALLGSISELERLVQAYAVDDLIIALPAHRREQVSRVLARGFHRRVNVKFLPDLNDLLPRRLEVHQVAGRRYIGFWSAARVSWLKRAFDLSVVGAGLLALLPVFAVIAVCVKLDSRGPVFYRQTRVGRNGRPFEMLKFRSMCQDADKRLAELMHRNEASGPLFKIRKDPRITRVGAFLRRWSLDELPQLLNVMRGDMSLVGPRPPLPSEVAKYEDWQLGRLRAVPGVTGLWQVSGRSEVPFHDMVRLDLHYIRNWSLGLDLEILLRTVPAVLTNRGAY